MRLCATLVFLSCLAIAVPAANAAPYAGGGAPTAPGQFDTAPTGDCDGDGVINANDADDDNDGIPDTVELGSLRRPTNPCKADSDGDGKADNVDACPNQPNDSPSGCGPLIAFWPSDTGKRTIHDSLRGMLARSRGVQLPFAGAECRYSSGIMNANGVSMGYPEDADCKVRVSLIVDRATAKALGLSSRLVRSGTANSVMTRNGSKAKVRFPDIMGKSRMAKLRKLVNRKAVKKVVFRTKVVATGKLPGVAPVRFNGYTFVYR